VSGLGTPAHDRSSRVCEGGFVFDDRNEFFSYRLPKLAGKHFAVIGPDGIRAKHQGCIYGSELKQSIEVR
jgi:hypothetical protein